MKKRTISPVRAKSSGRNFGRLFVGIVWAVMALVVTAASLEGYLAFKWGFLKSRRRAVLKQEAARSQPEFRRISRAYHPFAVQHINPFYLFFFPFDRDQRTSINNDVCSIGRDGFRGPGPEEAGDRKLAFMVGGSAVFGHYASSDSTTIIGYLNCLQTEFFFVNAGVPSWNSLQELYRLAFQILDFDPELIIAYDGGNDIALTCMYAIDGLDYPPGTPESFDKLNALVEDIRGAKSVLLARPWTNRLFPRLTGAVQARISPKAPALNQGREVPKEVIREATGRFLSNLEHMQAMTQASGARFIAVFQPIGQLHPNAPDDRKANPITPYMRMFRDQVFSTPNSLVEHLDFSTLFERLDGTIPWLDQPGYPDLSDDTLFIDGFHLNDAGNRMVAEEIVAYLQETGP